MGDYRGPLDVLLAHLDTRSLLNWILWRKSFIRMFRYEHLFLLSFDVLGECSPDLQVELIKKRASWVPTLMRMLRFVNAPFLCELCGRRISSKSGSGTNKSFWLSMCYTLVQDFTSYIDSQRYNKQEKNTKQTKPHRWSNFEFSSRIKHNLLLKWASFSRYMWEPMGTVS